MSWSARAHSHSPARGPSHFYWVGKKCEKNHHQRLRAELEKSLRSPDPEGNLEDHHEDLHDSELEWQRSAG